MSGKTISIVSPCWNEEDNVRPCYEAIRSLFEERLPGYEFEHIFCDNGSTDRTVEVLRELAAEDGRVKVIVNSRNYGPFRSAFNAILRATGDAVVPMLAVDLQDPPELIVTFVEKWEEGYQVVAGARRVRREPFLLRSVRKLYYRIVSALADFSIPPDVGEFQLIDRVIVEGLRQFDDHYPYIRGMIADCGYDVTTVDYEWRRRERGVSKNRLYHLIDQGVERDHLVHQRAAEIGDARRLHHRAVERLVGDRAARVQHPALPRGDDAGYRQHPGRGVLLRWRPAHVPRLSG